MKLHKLATVLAFGLCILSALANANAAEDRSIRPLALSQQQGVKRTDLLRHDLSVSGSEVVQVRVDFAPGVAFPPHSHPGEEIAYVIEGLLEYQIEGKPPVTLETLNATARGR